jgi:hypothetical protein
VWLASLRDVSEMLGDIHNEGDILASGSIDAMTARSHRVLPASLR